MKELVEVPHIEIRKTDVRQCRDVSFEAEGPVAVLPLLRDILAGKEQESFVILLLDMRLHVTGWREVARGAADHVEVPVREMFRTALAYDARALVLSHNHPSGDPKPSEEDKFLTEEVRKVGHLLSLPILDHIIIGDNDRYYSFGEGGFGGRNLPTDGKRQPPELDD